jgi:hypothetical protein
LTERIKGRKRMGRMMGLGFIGLVAKGGGDGYY